MTKAYYNEHDPKAAAALRELILAGLIAPGDVDERSIEDVLPSELVGYTQCHFFAGIGIWSHAFRQAGWPDDRPVWTGSCPCQPFSAAGQRAGLADERHLWPAFHWLISQCRPDVVFGEQVASKDGLAWLDIVQADLEAAGYAVGALDLCAAGFGAPHIRQRLFFVADAQGQGIKRERRNTSSTRSARGARIKELGFNSPTDGMADAAHGDGRGGERGTEAGARQDRERGRGSASGGDAGVVGNAQGGNGGISIRGRGSREGSLEPGGTSPTDQLDDTLIPRLEGYAGDGNGCDQPRWQREDTPRYVAAPGPTNGFWRDAAWLYCRDGKFRPVKSGLSPLVNGLTGRVGRGADPSAPIDDPNNTPEGRVMRLRGYGNAIVAPVAIEFIRSYMDVRIM